VSAAVVLVGYHYHSYDNMKVEEGMSPLTLSTQKEHFSWVHRSNRTISIHILTISSLRHGLAPTLTVLRLYHKQPYTSHDLRN